MRRELPMMSRFARGLSAVFIAVWLVVAGGCSEAITGPTIAEFNRGHGPADPLPPHPEKGPFLFCYFLGNGDGLHFAASSDGLTFRPIGGDKKIFLKPAVGANIDGSWKDHHLLRD